MGNETTIEDGDPIRCRVVLGGDEPRVVGQREPGCRQSGAHRGIVEEVRCDSGVVASAPPAASAAVECRTVEVVDVSAPVAAQHHEPCGVVPDAGRPEDRRCHCDLLVGRPPPVRVGRHGRRRLGRNGPAHRPRRGGVGRRRHGSGSAHCTGDPSERLGEGEGRRGRALRRCEHLVNRVQPRHPPVVSFGPDLDDGGLRLDDDGTRGHGIGSIEIGDGDRQPEEPGEPDGLVGAGPLEVSTKSLGPGVDAAHDLRRSAVPGPRRGPTRSRFGRGERRQEVVAVAAFERVPPDGQARCAGRFGMLGDVGGGRPSSEPAGVVAGHQRRLVRESDRQKIDQVVAIGAGRTQHRCRPSGADEDAGGGTPRDRAGRCRAR